MKKIILPFFLIFFLSFTQGALAEVTFGDNVRVDDTGDLDSTYQQYPAIATDASGNVYIVWHDKRDSGSGDIYFAKSTDGGQSFTSHKRVDDSGPPSASLQVNPAIAVTPDGKNIYVVWQDNRKGNYDIYFAKSENSGASFIELDNPVNDSSGRHQWMPSIALDGNGDIYVAWSDQRNQIDNNDIYFAKSTNGGATFTTPNVRVDDTETSASDQVRPKISVDNDGNIYVVWYDDRNSSRNYDIYFAKGSENIAGKITFNSNVRVDDTGTDESDQGFPSIAVDTDGNIYVAWDDNRNHTKLFDINDIYFAKMPHDGTSFEENIRVDDTGLDETNQCSPVIATDLQGNIYVTWTDYRNNNNDYNIDIYFTKGTENIAGEITFSPNIPVNDPEPTDPNIQASPSIAVAPNGSIYVVWQDKRKGDYDIYFAKGEEPGALILDVPYCPEEILEHDEASSGAASSEMILDFIYDGAGASGTSTAAAAEDEETGLTQQDIYDYGHQYNYSENQSLDEMDPRAIDYALGHFDPYDTQDPHGEGDPYKAYNFSISEFEDTPEGYMKYIRDIVHWIDYPVVDYWSVDGPVLVAQPNTPAMVPAYGKYDHWIAVHGFSASEDPCPEPYTNPWYTPDFTVNGLWISDPTLGGDVGSQVYVAAEDLETYLHPVSSNDCHNGKYVQVAEPPYERSTARIELAEPVVNEETLKLIEIAQSLSGQEVLTESEPSQDMDMAGASSAGAPPANKLDWREIIDSPLLTDGEFIRAFYGSRPRNYIKVRRVDKENSFYYLIPFDKYVDGRRLTSAAIIVNAEDGSFRQASWAKEPSQFTQINKGEARRLVTKHRRDKGLKQNKRQLKPGQNKAELIWQPKGPSPSPFYPYWKIILGNTVYHVTQDGQVSAE